MMNFINYLNRRSRWSLEVVAYAFAVLIGVIDYFTGPEIASSLFYLIPVFLVTWLIGSGKGILISIVSTVICLLADLKRGYGYSHPVIPYWNAFVRFGFFIVVTLLLSALKKALATEEKLARIDFLTGISNRRAFFELAELEINRARRYGHTFSFVYLDLDDFKVMNDKFGHLVGDNVLRLVATTIHGNLRKTDVVARLGGDEFAILLPEIDLEVSSGVVPKIQSRLTEVMQQNHWPLTFSMGAVTFKAPPESVDEMIRKADHLMYSSKNSGKNAIMTKVFGGK